MIRLFFFLGLIPTLTFAQNNTQNIRGIITDKLSQTPYYYENYYRLDIKAGYTLNSGGRKVSHTFSLDLQNVTDHKNVFSQSYDGKNQSIKTTYQLGFFPNVIYKLQF